MKYKTTDYAEVTKQSEKDALRACARAFTDDMLRKLSKKVDAGKEGWDNSEWTESEIFDALLDHVDKLKALNGQEKPEDILDVAAFCMFWWNRKKEEK